MAKVTRDPNLRHVIGRGGFILSEQQLEQLRKRQSSAPKIGKPEPEAQPEPSKPLPPELQGDTPPARSED